MEGYWTKRVNHFGRMNTVSLSLPGWMRYTLSAPPSESMRELLECRCEGSNCDRPLSAAQFMLAYTAEGITRRAYECSCGAITITVGRPVGKSK